MEYFMEWDDSLNTGIATIDQQHRGIVDFINKLHASAIKEDRETVENVLTELTSYTNSHFTYEEQLLHQHEYPLLSAHKRAHDNFVIRLEEYKKRHNNGENIAHELSGELVIWLTNHIKHEDQDYVPYCKKKGVKGLLGSMVNKFK